MKNAIFILSLIIVSILIIFGFIFYKYSHQNISAKSAWPFLLRDEKVKYFDLISEDGSRINDSVLRNDNPNLILIFPRQCTQCDKNINIWKRIVTFLNGTVKTYGIVLNDISEANNIRKQTKINFNLYIPADLKMFLDKFRIKSDVSQTILYDGRIKFIALGELSPGDSKELIKLGRAKK